MDGLPIYRSHGCLDEERNHVIEMTSGCEQTADPTREAWGAYRRLETEGPTRLDEGNGRVQPDGSYGYPATTGFPYILGYYRGTPGSVHAGASL